MQISEDIALPATAKPADLRTRLLALKEAIEHEEARQRAAIARALPKHRVSATNLAHYFGLRKQEVRRLQLELAAVGLSSLGRCEGEVRDTLLRLCAWLDGARGDAGDAGDELNREKAEKLLHENSRALFGPMPRARHVYIMVTAPDAADATPSWADDLFEAGADVLRINGAHQSPAEWRVIASAFKEGAKRHGRVARVFVDLPGPKLRAEICQFEDTVLHLPRRKDRLGRTIAPSRVLLVAQREAAAGLPIPPEWLPLLQAGDKLRFTDAGGRDRELEVRESAQGGWIAECGGSLYVVQGLALAWLRGQKTLGEGRVGKFPKQPRTLLLNIGDTLLLNPSGQCDDPKLPVLALPLPHLLEQVRAGEAVILDDGRLVAIVESVRSEGLLCRITRVLKSPARLRSGKGIAFPESRISMGHLDAQDEAALDFALSHADGVGVSFVNTAADVSLVGERIRAAGKPGFGMILKLETRAAMRNLSAILFETLRYDPVGLMIARGDLALELSFERLAEMQEELLWFGEACHLPVIWATQVLDSAAHTGLATRAEITDAAMSMRAECVMLNKGPYIGTATRMLADIIHKMEAHQFKKRSLYRPLAVAGDAG